MTVHDLTQEQLEELRDSYFHQLIDEGDGIDRAEDIPMEIIMEHYGNTQFVDDDFFCSSVNADLASSTTQALLDELKGRGWYVGGLWNTNVVKRAYEVSEDKAMDVLREVLSRDDSSIYGKIEGVAKREEFKEKNY